ncbi:MAG: hypothetical protein WC048_02305 [Rhizobium sp.]
MSTVPSMSWHEEAGLTPYEETEEYWLKERAKKRNELIERVRCGELTKQQAETEARTARVGPLASRLRDITALTADMTFWTIEMTAAWIKNRSAEAVHRHYHPSYAEVLVWRRRPNFLQDPQKLKTRAPKAEQRYDLVELTKAQFGISYVDFDGEARDLPAVDNFFPGLRLHLLTGDVPALGTPAGSPTERPEISAGFWATCQFKVTDEEGACLYRGEDLVYRDIRFRAPELLKFYPPPIGSRLKPGRVYPWKEIIGIRDYKAAIVEKLRSVFPRGIPEWGSHKLRDRQLAEALGIELTRRWWIRPDHDDRQFNGVAFRVAMDRLLHDVLEEKAVLVENFY